MHCRRPQTVQADHTTPRQDSRLVVDVYQSLIIVNAFMTMDPMNLRLDLSARCLSWHQYAYISGTVCGFIYSCHGNIHPSVAALGNSSEVAQASVHHEQSDGTTMRAHRLLERGIKHFGSEFIPSQRSRNSLRLKQGTHAEVERTRSLTPQAEQFPFGSIRFGEKQIVLRTHLFLWPGMSPGRVTWPSHSDGGSHKETTAFISL